MKSTKQYVSCAVSNRHVIALTRDGQILSTGNNDFGQIQPLRFISLFSDFDNMIDYLRQGRHRMTEQDEGVWAEIFETLAR
jgi:hypothetical protein